MGYYYFPPFLSSAVRIVLKVNLAHVSFCFTVQLSLLFFFTAGSVQVFPRLVLCIFWLFYGLLCLRHSGSSRDEGEEREEEEEDEEENFSHCFL